MKLQMLHPGDGLGKKVGRPPPPGWAVRPTFSPKMRPGRSFCNFMLPGSIAMQFQDLASQIKMPPAPHFHPVFSQL